jgi:hypothetical protein
VLEHRRPGCGTNASFKQLKITNYMFLREKILSELRKTKNKIHLRLTPAWHDIRGQISKYVEKSTLVGALDATRLAKEPISSLGRRARPSK